MQLAVEMRSDTRILNRLIYNLEKGNLLKTIGLDSIIQCAFHPLLPSFQALYTIVSVNRVCAHLK